MSWVALIPPRGDPPVIQHLHKLLLYIVPKPPRCFTLSTKLLELWEERLLHTMRFRWAAITILRHFHQLQEKTCTFEQCPPRPQYLPILPTPLRNAYSSSWLSTTYWRHFIKMDSHNLSSSELACFTYRHVFKLHPQEAHLVLIGTNMHHTYFNAASSKVVQRQTLKCEKS